MKSRWTTYLLLAAVVAVWGVVGWKLFTPSSDTIPPPPPARKAPLRPTPAADTLRLDYPDPFLKRQTAAAPVSPIVRALPPPPKVPVRRERVKMVHVGTISVAGRPLYILTLKDHQYELTRGEEAEGFTLTACDRDSLYLSKEGLTYGVKLCE